MHTGFLAVPALFSALRWQKKRLQNQWERWCAARQEGAAARPRHNPSPSTRGREQQDEGKALGHWGKDAPWQEADHIQCSPPALPSMCSSAASRTSTACSPVLLTWPAQAPKNLPLGNHVSEARAGLWGSGSFILIE